MIGRVLGWAGMGSDVRGDPGLGCKILVIGRVLGWAGLGWDPM